MRLKGKTALITGGGAGIGAASAKLFCREGATVLLVDQDEKDLRRTAKALKGRASWFTADVADAQAAARAVAQAVQESDVSRCRWRKRRRRR